jgi:ribosomal protein S18 acetylase RimI-like enzyme
VILETPLAHESIAGTRTPDTVLLRPMRAADLKAAHALSVAVHWPHRLDDWQAAFELGEGIVAEQDGRLVGTALCWKWGSDHATLGLVIVDPQAQGQRIGHRLMQGLLDTLGDRTVLLHATPQARGLYERLGFVRTGEVHQHQGTARPAPLVALKEGWRLRPSDRNDEARIVSLDAEARGMPREALIRQLLAQAQTVMLDNDGHACGFAMLRRFGKGLILGPVVAPHVDGAKVLIAHLVGLSAGKFVRIDVDGESGLTDWLAALGLKRVDAPTVMVRGEALPRPATMRAFALVTQALG